MGMYDELVCAMTLPGKAAAWLTPESRFQTKDLDCTLSLYHIAENGVFSVSGFTGTIDFYNSNIVGSGPGLYTRNGELAESVDYRATIVDGLVTKLEQTCYESQPAWPSSAHRLIPPDPPIAPVIPTQPFLGQRLYVLFGGQEAGFWVKVIAENERQLCVEHEAKSKWHRSGDFEVLDAHDVGRLIWGRAEDAHAKADARKHWWDETRAEFDAFVEANGGVVHIEAVEPTT